MADLENKVGHCRWVSRQLSHLSDKLCYPKLPYKRYGDSPITNHPAMRENPAQRSRRGFCVSELVTSEKSSAWITNVQVTEVDSLLSKELIFTQELKSIYFRLQCRHFDKSTSRLSIFCKPFRKTKGIIMISVVWKPFRSLSQRAHMLLR